MSDPSCSFCGSQQADVKRMVVGPAVYICSACVVVAVDMLTRGPKEPGVVGLPGQGILSLQAELGRARMVELALRRALESSQQRERDLRAAALGRAAFDAERAGRLDAAVVAVARATLAAMGQVTTAVVNEIEVVCVPVAAWQAIEDEVTRAGEIEP